MFSLGVPLIYVLYLTMALNMKKNALEYALVSVPFKLIFSMVTEQSQ